MGRAGARRLAAVAAVALLALTGCGAPATREGGAWSGTPVGHGLVAGRVVNDRGRAVPGAVVLVVSLFPGGPSPVMVSAGRGVFAAWAPSPREPHPAPAPGPYAVVAAAPGYVPSPPVQVQLEPRKQVRLVLHLKKRHGPLLPGRILGSLTGRGDVPAGGVLVRVQSVRVPGFPPYRVQGDTDRFGRFDFRLPGVGTYGVQVLGPRGKLLASRLVALLRPGGTVSFSARVALGQAPASWSMTVGPEPGVMGGPVSVTGVAQGLPALVLALRSGTPQGPWLAGSVVRVDPQGRYHASLWPQLASQAGPWWVVATFDGQEVAALPVQAQATFLSVDRQWLPDGSVSLLVRGNVGERSVEFALSPTSPRPVRSMPVPARAEGYRVRITLPPGLAVRWVHPFGLPPGAGVAVPTLR